MTPKDELNAELLAVCTTEPIDYDRVKKILCQGAEPLGKVIMYGESNNLYDEILFYLFDNDQTSEELYRITELFLQYGMDISKPAIP